MIHGYKTKVSAIGMALSAGLVWLHLLAGLSLFMASSAVAFYGVYDRNARNHDEMKKRTKKPMLRSGH